MELRTSTEATYDHPRSVVFDFLVKADNYPRILKRLGPLPGIASAQMVDDQVLERGARRVIELDDGSVLNEEIIAFERPVEHAYRWGEGLKPPLSWLVRGGTGRWRFVEQGERTHVHWSYTFELKSLLAYPVARAVVLLFTAWMRKGLGAARVEMASTAGSEARAQSSRSTA